MDGSLCLIGYQLSFFWSEIPMSSLGIQICTVCRYELLSVLFRPLRLYLKQMIQWFFSYCVTHKTYRYVVLRLLFWFQGKMLVSGLILSLELSLIELSHRPVESKLWFEFCLIVTEMVYISNVIFIFFINFFLFY